MPIITVEKPLKEKLGEEAVESLVRLLNNGMNEQKGDMPAFLEEKFERRLSLELGSLEKCMTIEISKLNERITIEIANVNERITIEVAKLYDRITQKIADLHKYIANLRADLLKWIFLFRVSQLTVMIGILFSIK